MISKGSSIGSLGWEPFHRVFLSARRIFTYRISVPCFPVFLGKNVVQLYLFQACNDTLDMEQKPALKECKTDSRHRTDVQCPALQQALVYPASASGKEIFLLLARVVVEILPGLERSFYLLRCSPWL